MYFFGVLAILCLPVLIRAKVFNHGKIVVACPTNSQSFIIHRGVNDFKINETNWGAFCTHIIFGGSNTEFKMTSDNPIEDIMQITGLKGKYPKLKISFNAVAHDMFNQYREAKDADKFFTNYATFLIKYNFDGLDVMFGNIEKELIRIEEMSSQKDDFFVFFRRLKCALNEHNLYITSTFSATLAFTSMKVDFVNFVNIFELFHVLSVTSYPGEGKNTFGNILNEMEPLNVEQKIINLIKIWGIPPSQIIPGFHFGGPTIVTKLNENAMFAINPKVFTYTAACEFLASNRTVEKIFERENQLIRLRVKYGKKDRIGVYTYPTSKTIANFVKRVVVGNGLAGILAISPISDDYRGLCKIDDDTFNDFNQKSGKLKIPKRPDNKFPLMRTINEAFLYLAIDDKGNGNATTPITGGINANEPIAGDNNANKPTTGGVNANKPTTGCASSLTRNSIYMSLLVCYRFSF